MKAKVGDWLVIEGTNLGDRRRTGLITRTERLRTSCAGSTMTTSRWCSLSLRPERLLFARQCGDQIRGGEQADESAVGHEIGFRVQHLAACDGHRGLGPRPQGPKG